MNNINRNILPFENLITNRGPHRVVMLLSIVNLIYEKSAFINELSPPNMHDKGDVFLLNINKSLNTLFESFNDAWPNEYKVEANDEKRFGDPFFHLQNVKIQSGKFWELVTKNEIVTYPITTLEEIRKRVELIKLDGNFVRCLSSSYRKEIELNLNEKLENFLEKHAQQSDIEAKRGKTPSPSVPPGNFKPKISLVQHSQHQRDPEVREYVLKMADGKCECCDKAAPFVASDGTQYLELHHVLWLRNGGPDVVYNVIAACPNCHRELHHGAKCDAIREHLYKKITRLKRY